MIGFLVSKKKDIEEIEADPNKIGINYSKIKRPI